VLEVACGTGQGLPVLAKVARTLEAGDLSQPILDIARTQHGGAVHIQQFSADKMPMATASKDVVLLLEALYYLPNPDRFITEAGRVLREGGKVLIATANKDLYDFNPSPHSFKYLGVIELDAWLERHGFAREFFGYLPISSVSRRQRIFRPLKRLAVTVGLVPKTMKGKKILRRLVFGRLVTMPSSIDDASFVYSPPDPIDPTVPDRKHKVIYCVATLTRNRADLILTDALENQ
jgi:SAM-dependent methyltransferase